MKCKKCGKNISFIDWCFCFGECDDCWEESFSFKEDETSRHMIHKKEEDKNGNNT